MTPPEEPTSVGSIGLPCSSGGINPSTLGSTLGINQSSETPMHTAIQINAPEPQQQQQQQMPQSSHHLQGTIV